MAEVVNCHARSTPFHYLVTCSLGFWRGMAKQERLVGNDCSGKMGVGLFGGVLVGRRFSNGFEWFLNQGEGLRVLEAGFMERGQFSECNTITWIPT